MSLLSKLLKRGSKPKAGQLYGAAVAQARDPAFYTSIGIDDTPDGRFAMISLHILLILERLSGPTGGQSDPDPTGHVDRFAERATSSDIIVDLDPALGRALMEVFVEDLDQSMRELGIGDMGVPKRVKKAIAQFYQYARRYRTIRQSNNKEAMHVLLSDISPGLTKDSRELKPLSAYVYDLERALADETTQNLAKGHLEFPDLVLRQISRDEARGGGAVS